MTDRMVGQAEEGFILGWQATHGWRALLTTMRKSLADNGTDVAALIVKFDEPLDPKQVAKDILATASKRDGGTVVVGRHTFTGLKISFQHHVGEVLVRRGNGVTVWVVE